jgi:type III pantothenate kinase
MKKDVSGEQRSENKRRFIEAAYGLIREVGPDGVSVRKIAVKAGFHNSTIHMYFDDAEQLILLACVKYLEREPLFIQAGIKTGLKLRYSNPKEIGADLIAAAMGAVDLYAGKNLIIIDMGTAITAELVSKDKEFLGGVIMPGMKISVDALAGGTAKLTSVEIMKPEHVYGLTTTEAIQAGLYYGTAGALKEFCYQFKKNVFHGEDTMIIGTGGFARTFEDYKLFDEIIPGLVLSGVKVALDLN